VKASIENRLEGIEQTFQNKRILVAFQDISGIDSYQVKEQGVLIREAPYTKEELKELQLDKDDVLMIVSYVKMEKAIDV